MYSDVNIFCENITSKEAVSNEEPESLNRLPFGGFKMLANVYLSKE